MQLELRGRSFDRRIVEVNHVAMPAFVLEVFREDVRDHVGITVLKVQKKVKVHKKVKVY